MPNHVTNLLTLNGEKSKVKEALESVQYKEGEAEEWGKGTFDFNKVIPMPKSLMVTSGSITNDAVEVYMSAVNPNNPKFCYDSKLDTEAFVKLAELVIAQRHFYFETPNFLMTEQEVKDKYLHDRKMYLDDNKSADSVADIVQYGARYIQNLKEHGAMTWYDWCCYHWGTKWNAYDFIISENPNSNQLVFHTAWSAPQPVIQALSEKYPDVIFTLKWSNEDLGSSQGSISYQNGEITDHDIPECFTDEAYYMAEHILDSFE